MNVKNTIVLALLLCSLIVEAAVPTYPFGPFTVLWPLILIPPKQRKPTLAEDVWFIHQQVTRPKR